MSEPVLRPLSLLVDLVTDRTLARKDLSKAYVGLEHIPSSGSTLMHVGSTRDSVSTNGIFREGDILFGKLRPRLRKSVRVRISGYCSTDVLVLRPRSDVDHAFAGYVAQSDAVFERAIQTEEGTKMPRCSWKDLKAVKVFAPMDTGVQQRIAAILSSLDESMEATEALIEKHQQIKSGLMHDLITRGVMVNGKLRPPLETEPPDYRRTEIGWIPVNWQVVPLSSASELITSGSRGWSAHYSEDGATFIRIGNLTREHPNFRWEEVQKVAPPIGAEGARTKVAPGDVLVSITADLGICGVVSDDLPNAYVNQHTALVRPKLDVVNSRFVGHYMATHSAQSRLQQSNDSGAKAGLNLKAVGEFKIPLPSDPRESAAIVSTLDGVDSRIRALRANVEKLRAQKLGLMQDLLTGKVRVPLPEEEVAT